PRNPMLRHLKSNQAAYSAGEGGSALRGNSRREVAQRASRWETSEERRLRHKRRAQHAERRNAREAGFRVGLKQIRQTSLPWQEINRNGEKRRGERQVVHRPQIFSHTVDSIPGADGCVVMTKQVISKTDARFRHGGVVIAQ